VRIRWLALPLVLVALLAGCGDDESDSDNGGGGGGKPAETTAQDEQAGPPVGDKGGRAAADAFVACFKEPGFEPLRGPSVRQPAEVVAEEKGYEVEGLLMSSDGGVNSIFAQFFESEADRVEATKKLGLKFGSADVPVPRWSPSSRSRCATRWATRSSAAWADA
jgi:hypothetical protein